jgi:hypothetical protein
VTLVQQISYTLSSRFGTDLQLDLLPLLFDKNAWELAYSGPKSFVWSSEERVIKAYWSGGVRGLESIAHSYETAYRENPELFPPARVAGTGRLLPAGPDLLFIEQGRITARQPQYRFSSREWDTILDKWDRMIERHARSLPSELQWQLERLGHGTEKASQEISRCYFDGLAALQAPTGLRQLRDRHIIAEAPNLPQPQLSSVSKIVGDISPKHVLLDGPWLAFDLEKYGPGDPAKDLSTILRFYLYRCDPVNAERALKYLRERYSDPGLIYRVYLAALGSGSRLLFNPSPERSVYERYRTVLAFYPVAERCFG